MRYMNKNTDIKYKRDINEAICMQKSPHLCSLTSPGEVRFSTTTGLGVIINTEILLLLGWGYN